jgi:transcriptional regulator GlxA family with amidase domain
MTSNDNKPMLTVVIGTPEAMASSIYCIMDVLFAVGRDWNMVHGRPPERQAFKPLLLTLDGEPFNSPNGMTIRPDGKLDDYPEPDLIIVPDLYLLSHAPLPNNYAALAEWIVGAYGSGAMLSSVCSGSVLIAASGLLDGESATTHWGYCDWLKQAYPQVKVHNERILVSAGEGHRIITAGGASSWTDLLLYLIGRFVSPEEARRIAKLYLLQWHTDGQLPYASLALGQRHEDRVIADAQVWAADNYDNPNPVSAMVARSGLTERSFLRRFRRATGQSPLEYVQTLRIEESKQMLETSDMPLDDIAAGVGYNEPSSFRHLFRKLVGVSPSAYRKRSALPSLA